MFESTEINANLKIQILFHQAPRFRRNSRISLLHSAHKHFLYVEKLNDVLKKVHFLTGYGGRDKMLKEASKKFANVTEV